VDVTRQSSLAELLDVPAVPTAVALEGDGRILGRVSGFMEPAEFAHWLRELRTKPSTGGR
jgi:starvation-inducible outer membrane lipoprotein